MSARREPRRECANECSPPFTTDLIPPSKMLPRNARRVVLTAAMPLSVRVAMCRNSRKRREGVWKGMRITRGVESREKDER